MKFSGQTKEGAIDNLLRAYVSRPTNPHQACTDFDPDLANSYVERSLTGAPRLRYERHLSECAACRKSVVALARLAEADSLTTTVTPARQVSRSTWFTGVKQIVGALSQPQWAMAATAVIVLAVSVPLFLSSEKARNTAQNLAEQAAAKPAESASPASAVATTRPEQAVSSNAQAQKLSEKSDDKAEVKAKDAPVSLVATDSVSGIASGDLSKKAEFKSTVQTSEEAQRKSEGQVTQAPAQAGAAPAPQVAKTEPEQTRQQQREKDAAQQAAEPKLASRTDEDQRAKDRAEKEKNEKIEDAAAPPAPPPSSEGARGRSNLRRGRLALRDSGAVEAVRPEERKLSGKKFLFRDGAWTDKDFDPNKELPIVTIIRDSNVYKEVLNKRPGLKPYLAGFPASERAIIVYKGTVYKLIPQ
jgi:hypothetical protein